MNNQLSQENKIRLSKITELEQALTQEQQRVKLLPLASHPFVLFSRQMISKLNYSNLVR